MKKNVLIQKQPPDEWWVKISDFGLSKRFRNDRAMSSSIKGTFSFMAPELHGVNDETFLHMPTAADMWALGEMAYLLLTRRHVFENTFALYEFTQRKQSFPANTLQTLEVSDGALSFIQDLMKINPIDRLDAGNALQHPWMSYLVKDVESIK